MIKNLPNGVKSFLNYSSALLVSLACSFYIFSSAHWYYYKYRDIENVFQVELLIPNFQEGENPSMIYKNSRNETFEATFDIEVRDTQHRTFCRGTTFQEDGYTYNPDDKLPDNVTLNWFLDKDPVTNGYSECAHNLKPGNYYLWISYDIKQANRPDRELTKTSNVFEVTKNED